MQIAAVACQREVIRVLGAAVLLRHDVLYMMDQFAVFLAQPAIFATLASPPPDEVIASSHPSAIESSSPDTAGL